MLLTLLALLFSGLAQATISPPWSWVLLHPVSWVPALAVFSRLGGRRALLAGWLVGISANLAIFCWLPGTMTRFGDLPQTAAVAVWLLFAAAVGFYTALFAWGLARVRRVAGPAWPFAAAAWFCALEFLNPQLFGYLQGVAWYQVPHFFLISAATGVSGVSFLILLCNAVLLQGLELRGSTDATAARAWRINTAVLIGLVLAAVGYSTLRLGSIAEAEATATPIRVAVIQPNHTIERRNELSRMKPDAFAEDLLALSREAAAKDPSRKIDVYVWPEGALRADPAQPRNRAVLDFVRDSGAEIWTGANHYETDDQLRMTSHNSAFRLFGQGRIDRRYDKNILVPFGEYVPGRDVIPGFDRIHTVGHFQAGTEVPAYTSGTTRFVFLICYEAIRSAFVRAAVAAGDVNLLVNVTVDAWYGDSSEQSQHLMLAAIQAATNGVPLLRSTTTGISAIVDARGVLTAQTATFTRESLVADVRPLRVSSLVARWGDWFAWSCVAVSVLLMLAPWSRRRGNA